MTSPLTGVPTSSPSHVPTATHTSDPTMDKNETQVEKPTTIIPLRPFRLEVFATISKGRRDRELQYRPNLIHQPQHQPQHQHQHQHQHRTTSNGVINRKVNHLFGHRQDVFYSYSGVQSPFDMFAE